MPPVVNLYAEFLLNIRQVTIYANLEDEQKSDRSAFISSDTKSLTVFYDGEAATITFPSGMSGTAKVEFPLEKRKAISLRLEIAEDDKPSHTIGMNVDNDAPWPASCLSSETRIACRSCRQILVEQGKRRWKDLPREHWAELMDLWHCHKPAAPLPEGSEPSSKGYAAGNIPKVRQGLAFVDTSHLLVTQEESGGVKVTEDLATCKECNAPVGILDASFEGIRFYKWSILVQRHQTASWEQNDIQNFVCAQLLALIESQATRKFVIHSTEADQPEKAVLVWVFNPDLKYSASYLNDGRPRRAMKVLFKEVEDVAAVLDSTPNADELVLPHNILRQFHLDLNTSNRVLPSNAKRFQDWRAALLDRFDPLGADESQVNG